ncbi:MAG: DNA topoisomerase 4 subunit A [Acidimicrobiia bacterium]|nr:DNA topoisomerase 4 subunit A [Acidimicrobiia bacterium]
MARRKSQPKSGSTNGSSAIQGGLLPFAREVIDVPVEEELGQSFLAYSLSVITARAIPDVRDGLKPVQRRILYSMLQMRLYPDRPHRKCAHVVGDVMAKFHPHGDSAIYDTLVRMGQDFSRPVTLIDPQGNFGSLDHPPAAYRYTECRLTDAAIDLLGEIDEETVGFSATYDGESTEPDYLPALLPNLLVNGSTGIAVGMATNMPTHNLGEIHEAIKLVMTRRRPKPTVDDLMKLVPGPDFPSGGQIIADGVRDAYETGRGTIRIRAKAEIIDVTRARKGIEVTELPYLVGVERVVSKIKDLINANRISGISDVTNLSDRKSGMRLLIECKTGVNPELLLEKLYKLTPLEETFGINNVVLVDGVPTTLGLYDLCRHYIEHRLDVVVKRTEYRLRKASERLHLVEGLLIAIDNIDEVVSIIRNSADGVEARTKLMERLGLSQVQAEYVLDLQLRRLTALSYTQLVAEKSELESTIADLKKILGSEQRRRTIVLKELEEIVAKYGWERRSQIITSDDIPEIEQLQEQVLAELPDDPCVVSLTSSGLLGREPQGTSKSYSPSRHDVLDSVVLTTLRQPVLSITAAGKLLSTTAADVPEVGGRSRGKSAGEVTEAVRNDAVIASFAPTGGAVMVVTAQGMAKRLDRSTLVALKSGRPVIKLAGTDRVVAAFEVAGGDEVVFVTSDAQTLRTEADGISMQGAAARGVAGIKLKGKAKVVGAGVASDDTLIVTVTDRGTAKATSAAEIPTKGRGTGGVRITKFRDEHRIDYAWVGSGDRIMCIVGQADAPTRPDNTPEPLKVRPTRRDGASSSTPKRILAVGSLRW